MSKSSLDSAVSGSGFSLKDQLFNRDRVTYLANLFEASDSHFDAKRFIREVMRTLNDLELKQRISHIADCLENYLSEDFSVAAVQIQNALPPPLDPNKSDDDFGDFIFAPLGEFVVRHGMNKKDVGRSLKTLKAITQRFSMEDAIRPFIDQHTEKTFQALEKWARDRHYHVRRLVSEGTRPKLPWSKRLSIPLERPLPLLDSLYADRTRYVTRSVANHLNDISKTQPALVIKTLKRWKKEAKQQPREFEWICKHALRTLVKQGDPNAMKFLGFRPDPKVTVTDLQLDRDSVRPGEAIQISFTVHAERDESLVVDYVIDFVKANGAWAPKVHKLKQLKIKKGESIVVGKRHPFRANATTFTLYPGTHRLTIQINGKPFSSCSFKLV